MKLVALFTCASLDIGGWCTVKHRYLGYHVALKGLLGPQTVMVSGMAETKMCFGQAFSVTSSTE